MRGGAEERDLPGLLEAHPASFKKAPLLAQVLDWGSGLAVRLLVKICTLRTDNSGCTDG